MAQPEFTDAELVVLLDHYLAGRHGETRSAEELSRTLRDLTIHVDRGDPQAFRNPDGVARAARRFGVYDQTAPGERDSPAYRRVWERYAGDADALARAVSEALAGRSSAARAARLEIHRWWQAEPAERYWLEATHRPDVGADLHAPQEDKNGDPYWSYELVLEVAAGDVVFHYDADQQAITSWSVGTGDHWAADAWWSALGTASRDLADKLQPHWFCGLHGPFALDQPVTRAELQERQAVIRRLREQAEQRHGAPLYSPFQLRRDGLRTAQGYLFKLPADLVAALPGLAAAEARSRELPVEIREREPTERTPSPAPGGPRPSSPPASTADVGQVYVPADETVTVAERDPFPVDPSVVERSLQSHAWLQNRLAAELEARGMTPLRPKPGDPMFDLAWEEDGIIWVAEVKSLTEGNEERQLRLGLGQVLRYRHLLSGNDGRAKALLFVEREPADASWLEICSEAGVELRWPTT